MSEGEARAQSPSRGVVGPANETRGRPLSQATPLGRTMKRLGWRRGDLAEVLGVDNCVVSWWLAERFKVPEARVREICAALGVEREDVVEG
jgi:DNA-binding Xre family transcriptional regulator